MLLGHCDFELGPRRSALLEGHAPRDGLEQGCSVPGARTSSLDMVAEAVYAGRQQYTLSSMFPPPMTKEHDHKFTRGSTKPLSIN